MSTLEGKVAIVTGGARGIGRGEARLLAAEGAAVVVNDLGGAWTGEGGDDRPAQEVADEIVADGGRAVANFDDVSSWEGGQALVQQAIDEFGGLDILVCNAGIVRDRMLFNMSEEEWDKVLAVHLKGHFVPTRFAAAHWRERSKQLGRPVGGRLVFTSSDVGLQGNVGQANYAAAKGGITSLMLVAARELARFGVTANAICPAARTRMTVNDFPEFGEPVEGAFNEFDPDNVAPWVVFLATDAAAGISGQVFGVRGGLVELFQGWQRVAQIHSPARWTVPELVEASAELFNGRSSQPPRLELLDAYAPAGPGPG